MASLSFVCHPGAERVCERSRRTLAREIVPAFAATRELYVPAHASFLRAYRQPLGGEAVSAGVPATDTVSVVGSSPLTPGVTYTLWVVGENSRSAGPESNRVAFTA